MKLPWTPLPWVNPDMSTNWTALDAEIDRRIKETFFVVEADSYAQHKLWCEYHLDVDWQQRNPGVTRTIGKLGGRPLAVSLTWNALNGKLVCFVDEISQVRDSEATRKWLEKTFTARWDNGRRWAHCDAMNFHLCIDALGVRPQHMDFQLFRGIVVAIDKGDVAKGRALAELGWYG